MDGNQLYRNAIEDVRDQTHLLFDRLNYFLAGSAFLVTAYAALAVSIKHWSPSQPILLLTYLVNGVGFYLSIFFAVINYLNTRIINVFSLQIKSWQWGFDNKATQYWQDSSELVRITVWKNEFHNDHICLIFGPIKGLLQFFGKPFHFEIAPYSYIVPLFLAAFWIVVYSFVFHPNGLYNLYFFVPFTLIIVPYLAKLCRMVYPKIILLLSYILLFHSLKGVSKWL